MEQAQASKTPGGAVHISDVWARDGLQVLVHEPTLRSPTTAEKVGVIEALDAAGVPEIQITGFAHPKVIPSLADADAVVRALTRTPHRAAFSVLVPNLFGARRAITAGVRTINCKLECIIDASATYHRLNTNMSTEEGLAELAAVVRVAAAEGIAVGAGVPNSFVCPYEGVMSRERIFAIVDRIVELGITEIGLADTIGLAWPTFVRDRCAQLLERWPHVRFGLHLHTLAGLALTNAFAAYEVGVRRFDGSVGGIGGGIAMPVRTTTMANVATEDLVYLFESCGVSTGIDRRAIAEVARHARDLIGTGGGHVSAFGTVEEFLAANRERLDRMIANKPGDSHRDSGNRADDARR